MALLIPAALLVAGCCVLGFAAWRDPELKGSGFAAILFFLLFGGPLGCFALGAWGLVRRGQWDSISISSILAAFDKVGVDVRMLREPAPWPALQQLNRWYLEANVGWTLLAVPAALIGVWLVLSKRAAPPVNKKAFP